MTKSGKRALLFLAVAGLLTSSCCWAALRVGAAQETITPDLKIHGPAYLAGFGNNRVATGIHDDLYARCFAVDAGGSREGRADAAVEQRDPRPRQRGVSRPREPDGRHHRERL